MLEKAAVFGRQCRLDHAVWNFFERHRVIAQDAALADLVAVAIEEAHRILAGQEFAFVEFLERGQRQAIEHEHAAEPDGKGRRRQLVENARPACQLETGKKARGIVPGRVRSAPQACKKRTDAGIEFQHRGEFVPPALF